MRARVRACVFCPFALPSIFISNGKNDLVPTDTHLSFLTIANRAYNSATMGGGREGERNGGVENRESLIIILLAFSS